MGHMLSSTPLCHCTVKAATENGGGCVLKNFIVKIGSQHD